MGVSGSTRKITMSTRPSAISAPICWSPPSGPLLSGRTCRAGIGFRDASACRARRDDVAVGERRRMAGAEGDEVILLGVMRDEGEPQTVCHGAYPYPLNRFRTVLMANPASCQESGSVHRPRKRQGNGPLGR